MLTMNKPLCVLVFLFVSAGLAFGCKCAPPPLKLNSRLAFAEWSLQRAQVIFEGTVERVELKGWPLKPSPGATITVHPVFLVTFANVRLYRGAERREFIVTTGLGGGDCGYHFTPGKSYLVAAGAEDSGELETGICSGTEPLEDAATELRMLRDEPPTPEDAADRANEASKRQTVEPLDYSKVCGKVSFPRGVKPKPVTVRIMPDDDPGPLPGDETETEDGAFCFSAVDPGKYLIAAIESDPATAHSRFAGYYPGVLRRFQAAPVVVKPGQIAVRADFTVARQPLYSVRGYLRGVPQSFAGSVQIILMTDHPDRLDAQEPVTPGPHGVFELNGVPAGHYKAFAVSQNDENDTMTFLSSVVEMEIHENVDDLKLEYLPRK
jgi:hypothetical protein